MTQQEIIKKYFAAKNREREITQEMLYQIELYREKLREIDDIYLESSRALMELDPNDLTKATIANEAAISIQRGELLAKISNTNAMRSLVNIF